MKGGVEPDLVVTCPGGTMGHGICAGLLHLAGDHLGLHNTFGRDRQRIDLAAKDIALDEVADPAVKNFLAGIDGDVLKGPEGFRALLDFIELC